MSKFEKALEKFNRIPIPNDITYDEMVYIVEHLGFEVETGRGKHGFKIRYRRLNIKIPIPIHGNVVQEAYIEQIKRAIKKIEENPA